MLSNVRLMKDTETWTSTVKKVSLLLWREVSSFWKTNIFLHLTWLRIKPGFWVVWYVLYRSLIKISETWAVVHFRIWLAKGTFDLFWMSCSGSSVIVHILLRCNIVILFGSVHFTILVQKSNSDCSSLCLLHQWYLVVGRIYLLLLPTRRSVS